MRYDQDAVDSAVQTLRGVECAAGLTDEQLSEIASAVLAGIRERYDLVTFEELAALNAQIEQMPQEVLKRLEAEGLKVVRKCPT